LKNNDLIIILTAVNASAALIQATVSFVCAAASTLSGAKRRRVLILWLGRSRFTQIFSPAVKIYKTYVISVVFNRKQAISFSWEEPGDICGKCLEDLFKAF
jgi:hypothetical protein